MANRLSKIVTKTGDLGSTSIATGERFLKSSLRIQCLGEVDELNCQLGVCIAHLASINAAHYQQELLKIQHHLFDVGAQLSYPEHIRINEIQLLFLEESIDTYNLQLAPLKEFILPSGDLLIAELHRARALCRRVERNIVHLHQSVAQDTFLLKYFNRLSDYLFVLLRMVAKEFNLQEVYWHNPSLS